MRALYFILFAVIYLLTGCSTVKDGVKGYYQVTDQKHSISNFFIHPKFSQYKINRVMIAPIKNETTSTDAEKIFESIFINEMSKINKFDIIQTPKETANEINEFQLHTKGIFYKIQLYDIGKRYNADGIIFTSITSFSPYEPCKIGVNSQLVDTKSGSVIWAVNETFDSNMRDVENSAKEYYFETLRFAHPLYDWKIMLSSIRYYAQFVSYEIANTLSGKKLAPRVNNRLLNTVTMGEDV